MTFTETETFTPLPDHTQLPCEDGTFVKNFQEHPQSILLTTSIRPILDRIHPDGQYCIGQDSGIYWRMTEPPQNGAEAPDWFYVPNVSPTLNGQTRRSYVLWQESIPPQIVLEFVSGNGSEERNKTPWKGKFWVYETVIRPAYYGIYEVRRERVEVYRLRERGYELIPPNECDRFPIETLGVELGLWQGMYQNLELPWLRWWDSDGNLLPSAEEDRDREKERADRAELELQQLRDRLQTANIDPDKL